ncbi:hypothetical protein H0H92_009286, partial [Tricholoma furcatifolium]
MSRGSKKKKTKVVDDPGSTHRICNFCNKSQLRRGFQNHQKFCPAREDPGPPAKRIRRLSYTSNLPTLETNILEHDHVNSSNADEPEQGGIDGDSCMTDHDDLGPQDPLHAAVLPDVYIKIVPHPHSSLPATIIPLDTATASLPTSTYHAKPSDKPWAPFRTLEDFEVTEFAVRSLLKKDQINTLLQGVNHRWTSGKTKVTLQNYEDMQKSLDHARNYIVKFKSGEVSVPYRGEIQTFKYEYRDPWEYVLSLVRDPSLASLHCWNSVKKFYCENEKQ